MKNGMSVIAVHKAFGTEEACISYLKATRWPNGPRCLRCGSDKVSEFITNETTREITDDQGNVIEEKRVPSRHLFQCNSEGCRFQFSATTGTIFDKSHLPLSTWFQAVAILVNAKKSVSAKQMERDLGVNYRTAWFLNHRIREAMQSELGLFGGTVEVDATFHGGRYDPRRKRAPYDKQAVAGIIQRHNEAGHSKVKALPVLKEIAEVMTTVIRENVVPNAAVMTDDHAAYMKLTEKGWKHDTVSHSKEEWVRGNTHTQNIENFWSLFKRQVVGQHHSISVKHLHRYLDECSFKFNNREIANLWAVVIAKLVMGSALRYNTLIGKTEEPAE
jgi:transposase-like protein